MSKFNFDELCAQARNFDKNLAYVRRKLMEPSKLGYGDKAATTLGDMKEEIASLEVTSLEMLRIQKQNVEVTGKKIDMMTSRIDKMWTNLELLENKWKPYGYKPCPLTDHLVDDTSQGRYNL